MYRRVNHYILATSSDFLFLFQLAGILLALLYGIFCLLFIVMVAMKVRFYYGFYRTDLPPPGGVFINDRYSYPWWVLMFDLIRVISIPSLIWVFQGITVPTRRTMIYLLFCLLFILDIILISAIFAMQCFFCNNGEFRNSLCDTQNLTAYCLVHWEAQPNLCIPAPLLGVNETTLRQCDLKPNPTYHDMLFFTFGFLGLDFLIAAFLWFLLEGGIVATFINSSHYDDSYSDGIEAYPDGYGMEEGDYATAEPQQQHYKNKKVTSTKEDKEGEENEEDGETEDSSTTATTNTSAIRNRKGVTKSKTLHNYGDERDLLQGIPEYDPKFGDPNEFDSVGIGGGGSSKDEFFA